MHPMKPFAFLIAVIVLALSFVPCADTSTTGNTKANILITKSTLPQDNPLKDECTPFCQCTCCAGFSVNHFIASITILPPNQSITKTAYLPAHVIEIAFPIWQPPQLV